MDSKDLLELAGAAWTIVRIVGPWVAPYLMSLSG